MSIAECRYVSLPSYMQQHQAKVDLSFQYFDDPNPHVLFYMFTLLRACATGGMIMTTPDFKTCCQIYPPGVQKNTGELPPDSQAHNAWRAFCNAVGGEDAVKSRMAKAGVIFTCEYPVPLIDLAHSSHLCLPSFKVSTAYVSSTITSMRISPFTKPCRAKGSGGTCTR